MTDWQTPRVLYDELSRCVGGFVVDAAASADNHLAPVWYGPGSSVSEDALAVDVWDSPAFCNPPYGKGIEKWLKKFVEQQKFGNTVVALLPARTEVRWWFDWVVPYASVVFLVGRVPFVDPGRSKPTQPDHGSAVCLYEPNVAGGSVAWLDWKERIKEQGAIHKTGPTELVVG